MNRYCANCYLWFFGECCPECDSDGTATAAINEDLPVPQDCQARAEGIAHDTPRLDNHTGGQA